jgi:hypothetical protein
MPIKQIPVNAETKELIRNFNNNQILQKKKEFVFSSAKATIFQVTSTAPARVLVSGAWACQLPP